MTREQILDLIGLYIYPNGQEMITAGQLNDILSEMAESFAMNDEIEVGIDKVLETDNRVSKGREITNDTGGVLKLAASNTIGDAYTVDYLGIENAVPASQAMAYVGQGQSAIGSVKRDDPSRNFFNMAFEPLLPGENLMTVSCISDVPADIKPGVRIRAADDTSFTNAFYAPGTIEMNVENSESNASLTLSNRGISYNVSFGDYASSCRQSASNISLQAKSIILDGDLSFMKVGKEILTATGSNSVFEISHGMFAPASMSVTFEDGSIEAIAKSKKELGDTTIRITCATNPPAGKITVYWQVFK